MHHLNQDKTYKPGHWIRPGIDFEDYFNSSVPADKIQFARHYVETKMGYDLNEDCLIDFSEISIKLFGCLVADIALEYEIHKAKGMDGWRSNPRRISGQSQAGSYFPIFDVYLTLVCWIPWYKRVSGGIVDIIS